MCNTYHKKNHILKTDPKPASSKSQKKTYSKLIQKPLLQNHKKLAGTPDTPPELQHKKGEKLAGGKKGLLQSLQKQEVFVRAIQGWT